MLLLNILCAIYRYQSHLDEAERIGVRKSIAQGGGMGVVFFIIFCVYAVAFWYGAKLVREDANYNVGTMMIVSLRCQRCLYL